MSNPIPTTLGLTSIPDGASIVASDHRNNYAALQAAVNELVAALSGGTAGQVLEAAGGSSVQWTTIGSLYRKTTPKQVINTIAETDLLNGEITIGAGVMGATGRLRLTLEGDLVNNTGGSIVSPRIKVKLGGTTLLDSGASASMGASAGRWGWKFVCEIQNLGATNAQWASLFGGWLGAVGSASAGSFATGEGVSLSNLISGGLGSIDYRGSNTGAVDTTIANALVFSVILGTASASCDITLKNAIVEVL